MFTAGQEVICIEDSWEFPGSHPVKGSVYTIERTHPYRNGRFMCVHLEIRGFPDAAYAGIYFRPVVKTDISVFTAMLNPSQVTVDALNMADFARELVQ